MISIVVPVYKVEKYLDKCVQSILAQTYKDFELILVDDGSPDNCPQMCDEYAKKNKKIRVVHKNNGGLSDARNAGTTIASGEFVTYVDSDDYVSKDYLAILNDLRIKHEADISVGGLCTFLEGNIPNPKKHGIEYSYTGMEALEKMLYQDTLDTSACAMLLPTALAKKYPFPVGKYHEDEFTTYKFYSAVKHVAVTSESIYFYLQRKNSIMHTFGQTTIDELDAADNLVDVCLKNWPNIVEAANSKKFSDYCQVLLSTIELKNTNPEMYNRIVSYLEGVKFQVLFDKNSRIKNRVAAASLLMGVNGLFFLNRIKKVVSVNK